MLTFSVMNQFCQKINPTGDIMSINASIKLPVCLKDQFITIQFI